MNRANRARLTLDAKLPEQIANQAKRDAKLLSSGIDMPLSESDKKRVIFSKYEARDASISDTNHGPRWHIQTGVHPNLAKFLEDGTKGAITEDDGLIIDFVGTPTAEVAIDLRSGRVLSDEDAELEEETLGKVYPRYARYDFFIDRIQLTDGPERRLKLQESVEEQRNRDQSDLISTMTEVFKQFGKNMGQAPNVPQDEDGTIVAVSSPQDMIEQLQMTGLSIDQIKAQLDIADDTNEPADATDVETEAILDEAEALK